MRLFEGTPFDVPPRCDRCGELEADCQCPPPPPERIPPAQQTAVVCREKRKRGKVVTLVRGLPTVGNDLPQLVTSLKTACGAGGTLKDGIIEIQGDQLRTVSDQLRSLGFQVQQR